MDNGPRPADNMDVNGQERKVHAGPVILEVTQEWPLVVLTLTNPEQDAVIKLPFTGAEATRLGKYLITVGMLTDV